MKIVEYLVLFVIEYNVQKVLFHLMYAVLKLMVDQNQPIIVIMTIANHQGLVIPSLQILKFKPKITQNML